MFSQYLGHDGHGATRASNEYSGTDACASPSSNAPVQASQVEPLSHHSAPAADPEPAKISGPSGMEKIVRNTPAI